MIGFGWLMELIAVPFLVEKQRVCQELFIYPTEKNPSVEMKFCYPLGEFDQTREQETPLCITKCVE
jgi:hypothetical protein